MIDEQRCAEQERTSRNLLRTIHRAFREALLALPAGRDAGGPKQEGLPGYTFERAPGKLWRSRFDPGHNVIVINNGHRDFVFASKAKALKLRYITRLYAKELALKNFPGLPTGDLLERLIELSLYTEEHLRG